MFFSVIIPVYNVERYLRECVDSVLSQSFDDFELILVDDGSKDNSGAICDEYARDDSRVKVIHKSNGGQSSARNVGVEVAVGRYAIFLDSDDFISSNDFFRELHSSAKDGADIIAYRSCKYYSDGRTDDLGVSIADLEGVWEKKEIIGELVKRDAFFCSCWSKATSLQLLKQNGIRFDENLICEDMDWYYSVIEHAVNIAVIDKPYINYRQRENSVTSSFKLKSVSDNIYILEKWSEKFLALEDGEQKVALFSSLSKLYTNLLISYARHTKEAHEYKDRIFSLKFLLKYRANPRVRTISRVSRVLGLRLACFLLRMLDRVR